MAITNENKPTAVRLSIVKGNELSEQVVETWPASAFYPTSDITKAGHGLYLGLNRENVVRVQHKLAALGWRGDYIKLEYDSTAKGTTTWAMAVASIFLDLIDLTAVPPDVQKEVYSKYTKYPAGSGKIIRVADIFGIDSQRINAEHNVAVTADDTYKDQKIRGSSSSRIQVKCKGATTAVTLVTMKIKPNADGVFIIPAGARIWVGSGTPT